MNGWFNPDNWMDIVDHFLLILGAISVAVIPSWFSARNHREIKDVKNQVVNGHKSPMRADLDRVLERLSELSKYISDIGRGVSGLRAELVDEESRRRESVRELRSDIENSRAEFRAGMSHVEKRISELENRFKRDE